MRKLTISNIWAVHSTKFGLQQVKPFRLSLMKYKKMIPYVISRIGQGFLLKKQTFQSRSPFLGAISMM